MRVIRVARHAASLSQASQAVSTYQREQEKGKGWNLPPGSTFRKRSTLIMQKSMLLLLLLLLLLRLLLLLLLLLSCRAPAIACGTFKVGVAPTDFGEVSPSLSVGEDPWPWLLLLLDCCCVIMAPYRSAVRHSSLYTSVLCERCFVEGVLMLFNHFLRVSCRLCTRYCTGDGGRGEKKSPSPGFPWVKQRVPGYSLLACSRVLGPQILARLKVLLVPVTSIDKIVCTCEYPRSSFKKGYSSRTTPGTEHSK